ncbi:hypothetical protein ACIP86_21260 [Pseudomonas neuropathica]
MNISLKAALPAAVVATLTVVALQMFLYDAEITLAQASSGTVPVQLIAEMLLTIALHLFVLLMIPVLLIVYRKYIAAYAVLALALSAYCQITTGLSTMGPMIAVIAFSILGFYGLKKASEWIRYIRAK